MNKKTIIPIFIGFLILSSNALLFISTVHAVTTSNESLLPATFSPDGNGLNDTVAISFESDAGQTLYLNIFYNVSELVRSDIAVNEVSSGSYSATWNGKDDNNSYVTDEDEAYTIRVSDVLGSGGGSTIGTVMADLTAPTISSFSIDGSAQYSTDENGNVTLTISASGATKIKVSNYANYSGATWETYTTSKSWTLLNPNTDGVKTVYINFRDAAGANASTTDTITLDTTIADPSLSINSGASRTNNTDVTLGITANGASQMKIDNNTGFANMSSWIDKTSTYSFSLPGGEGQKRVYLRIRDEAGNTKTTSDTITLDTTAPSNLSLSINSGASYTNSTSVTLTVSAEGGPNTMYLSNNGNTWTSYSYTTSKTWNLSSSDGTKTVYYKAADSAGNNATAISASITLDTTAPTQVTLSSPSSGATVTTQTPTFSWSNPNPSGTKNFKIEILQSGIIKQSDLTNSSTTSYTATTLAEGSYQWKVTVYDMANNSATTSQRAFTISVSGLAIPSPTYPTNSARVNNSAPNMIRLRWSQVSGQGTIYYDYKHALSESTLQNVSSNSTTNLYATISGYTQDQTVYWIVRARNTTHTSNYSSIRSFTVDNVSPVMNSITLASGAAYTNTPIISVTSSATGASWMKLSEDQDWDNKTWAAYTSSKSFTLSTGDGAKTVYLITKDNAVGDQGSTTYANINTSAISDTITLDTTAPTISDRFPRSSTSDSTPEISAEFSDSLSGVNSATAIITVESVNQTHNATITSSLITYTPTSTLSDGDYTVNITVADNVSNFGYLEWTFTVDTDSGGGDDGGSQDDGGTSGGGMPPPATTITITDITQTPTTITVNDSIEISATVTAVNGIHRVTLYYDINGILESITMNDDENTYSATIGPFVEGATVTYYIHVTDENAETLDSSNTTFTIDDTNGPTITLISPVSGSSITDTTPTITISYSDPSDIDQETISFFIDNNEKTSHAMITSSKLTYTPKTPLSFGKHTISMSVKDAAGNSNEKSWSFTLNADASEITETIDFIQQDETQEIDLSTYDSVINSIQITAAKDITNLSITCKTLSEKPQDVTTPKTMVYLYIDIETNIDETGIEELLFSFKISAEWFNTNNIEESSVNLLRYYNNQWVSLPTTLLNKDDTFYYFEATTPGLSTFAISGTPVEKPNEPSSEIPWVFIIIGIIVAIIVALVILVKTGYIYFEHEK